MGFMSRQASEVLTISVDTVLADAEIINFSEYAGGRVYLPTGTSVTTLTFHDSPEQNATGASTFFASYDDTATTPVALALTGLAASRSYPLPAKLFAAGSFKMVSNADGTVYVVLKP